MTNAWKAICQDKKKRQEDSIPKEWLARPPSEDRLNVVDFPRESGLLTPIELSMTDSNVETLLANLASGLWSSVDVTRGFYKRAILAHQTVCSRACLSCNIVLSGIAGELPNGNIRRPGLK